jgi:hypothetical protein
VHTPDDDAAEKIVRVKERHKHLHGRIHGALWGRYVARDNTKERFQILAHLPNLPAIAHCPAFAATRVQYREIELRLVCVESGEEIEHLVEDLLRAGVAAVDFVDEDYRLETKFERFGENKLRLRQRSFCCIDKQHDAIDHAEYALNFATKICAGF